MLAVLGATPAQAAALAARHDVTIANDNAPGEVALSGPHEALAAAERDARGDGLRAVSLDVSGAFHSPQMRYAVEPFREALEQVRFRDAGIPVVSSATTRRFREPAYELAEALVRPVRWRETMIALAAAGASTFVDVGPGATLATLMPHCVPGITAVSYDRLWRSSHCRYA